MVSLLVIRPAHRVGSKGHGAAMSEGVTAITAVVSIFPWLVTALLVPGLARSKISMIITS